MRVLIAAAVVLLATGVHARAQTPAPPPVPSNLAPQTSQWVLVMRLPSAIWTPGVYPTEERCTAARRKAARAVKNLVCMELLSP